MPILSYTSDLLPKVISGEKFHTIRFGSRIWKVGDQAIHASGIRAPDYREHRRDLVTRVDSITIRILKPLGKTHDSNIFIDDEILAAAAVCRLARNDGFLGSAAFFQYFRKSLKPGIHTGQLIQWKDKPVDYLNL